MCPPGSACQATVPSFSPDGVVASSVPSPSSADTPTLVLGTPVPSDARVPAGGIHRDGETLVAPGPPRATPLAEQLVVPGEPFGTRYHIIRVLGSGGMGVV